MDRLTAPFQNTLCASIAAIEPIAQGVLRIELRPAEPEAVFEPVQAGAHIDLHLPNGLCRSYSLVNEGERHRYVVAVAHDSQSRGGSAYVHEHLRIGDAIAIGRSRNHFGLHTDAARTVLVAGGIGITPLWSMVQRLERDGRPWTLYFCARTRGHAAFLAELEALAAKSLHGELVCVFDHEPGQAMLDLHDVVRRHGGDTHFYCCGPQPMLRAFEAATASLDARRVHVESFRATAAGSPADEQAGRPFEVELANSGRLYTVPPGKSILDVLIDAGESVMYSCKEGTCGTCEVPVLEGAPLHRDAVLGRAEREAGRVMMICVSRCRGERIKLDL
ncbi:PDR/VanB family oxidoreductase [Paraburkholderia pallida]|uniref:Oxidoreductase n=1 Tax=Paraburkholderia pallida TaxID=2547399 RepID=A0A4P7CZH1_9BURK|nr:PDR/VanB family oxidoreductase [Paraburkholderia pallida]QBQ99809.1 oxidoreductase [Paraburkholderia pallida]